MEANIFHAHKARRQPLEECQHIFPPQRPGHEDAAGGVNGMDLEDMLGQIEADGGYSIEIGSSLFHGRCSFR